MSDCQCEQEPDFASDLLKGADEVALYMYGDRRLRRKIYYLANNSRLPVFRIGATICARKSALKKFIEDQEGRRP